jgi:hypothetical protein
LAAPNHPATPRGGWSYLLLFMQGQAIAEKL